MTNRIVQILVALCVAAMWPAAVYADGGTIVMGGMTKTAPKQGSLVAPAGGGTSEGEMGDCLDDADSRGLGPKSALEACFQLVLTPDGGGESFPADPDTSD